ncbi:MAG: endonuclease domain-containing protein [Solirubrobacteraceae bacterium]|nr:endonuclease domain-containing protein [Solirubrobacteraceae bacterium]
MARRQLVRSGDEAIAHRLRTGRLHRLHRGVYVAGHTGLRLEGRLLAATFACGAGAVISHRTAAALLGVRHGSRELIDVTTVARGRRAPPGIDLHETRRLATWEVAERSGLPLTSVARTLADLAGVLSARDLERSLERADALQMLDVPSLLRSVEHRVGASAVRAALAGWMPAPTRSELETRLLALVGRAGFPPPLVNVPLHGYEVDLLWCAERVVAEADGHAFHASRAAIERDRARDAVLARHGYRVLRFTWVQVTRRRREVAAALRAALAHGAERAPVRAVGHGAASGCRNPAQT